jgi:hypothetical protein
MVWQLSVVCFFIGSLITYADALLSAMKCDAVKLDDLNLSSCSLPASALPYLSQIVSASATTLQRLELQGNLLDMSTPEALRDWEEFLTSFKDCVKMRSVNFSDNRLGDKGVETLVRVYTREIQEPDPILDGDLSEDLFDEALSRPLSGISINKHSDDIDDDLGILHTSGELSSSPTSSLAASALIQSNRNPPDNPIFVPTRGLRSIAYIHLRNVAMTDLSALHLTSLLPYHQLPHVLLRRLDAQVPDPSLGREDELYDPESLCRGVMYDIDIADLSPLAKKLLESVEKVRRAGGLQPQPPTIVSPSILLPPSLPPSPDSFRARRNSDSSWGYFPETPSPSRKEALNLRTPNSPTQGRSGSIVSMTPPRGDTKQYWIEVLKARPKIQGEILKATRTVHVSQLWSAGIKLLSLARIFTLPQPQKSRSNLRPRYPKQRSNSRLILPPSPLSPVPRKSSRLPSLVRSNCVGGIDKAVWIQILVPVADPNGVLSERQAMSVVDWAADRGSLAKEGEWAGKLQHVQMWKLLDVSIVFLTKLMIGFGMFGL